MTGDHVLDRAFKWYLWLFRITFVLLVCSVLLLIAAIVMGNDNWEVYVLPGIVALVFNSNRLALKNFKELGRPWKTFP